MAYWLGRKPPQHERSASMPFVSGFLRVRSGGSGNYPDNALPGEQPGIDNSLPGGQPGIDNALPIPPPGVWPPPVPSHPIVPAPPGTPPGTIWPSPGHPSHPIAPGGSPGVPTHPIAPGGGGTQPSHPIASGTYWMLVYTPGHGWQYVVVDPSLSVDASPPAPQPVPTPHK
jgi:hypothetical protein